MAASDEAASDEVQLALAALTESIPIITRSVIASKCRREPIHTITLEYITLLANADEYTYERRYR